ncbi:MAG: hypothetical protein NDI94_04220 [Candidatus Woesearchaeota archaeon]|nr:hypothetical protein [Candidatus Woesearchaeota archaeon]
MIISYNEAGRLLEGKKEISLDLGITYSKVEKEGDSFIFEDGQRLTEKDLKKIVKKDTMCFFIENSSIVPISSFSEKTNKFYKLVPTGSWPTIELSGIRMHVTKSMTPKEDTEKKISFVQPCTGKVLDTCTGLGYTAIMASKTADEVYTYEIDKHVVEIEKVNPYSKGLFNKEKIVRHEGDIFLEIKQLKTEFFDFEIHDPPRVALSTLLYSQEFYNQLFRVLKKGGKLYHYTGDPGSKRGLDVRDGIIKRLQTSGFKQIARVFNGITCMK